MFPVNSLFQRGVTYTLIKLVRFINLVKHIIDKESGMESLSEIPAIFSGKNASIDKHIITKFLKDQRLIAYDINKKMFYEERQDNGIINHFFREAKGKIIKGFKTSNSLTFDV